MSAKKRAEIAETGDLRREWREAIGVCEWCEGAPASDVHEIVGGKDRQRTVRDPRQWVALCATCHREHWQSKPLPDQFDQLIEICARSINRAVGRNVV